MRWFVLLLGAAVLAGGEALIAWPAIVCADEQHSVTLHLPGGQASFGWDGGLPLALTVPEGGGEALLLLPQPRGTAVIGALHSGGAEERFSVRLVDAAEAWPVVGLRDGQPVDADGTAVVLVDRRRTANDVRRARLGAAAPARPNGRPLLVGDAMATAFGSPWSGLMAEQRSGAGHAVLVALADPGRPRSIVWCPDQVALIAGTWAEEGRLCSALSRRLAALGIAPRLVVALPPAPVDPARRDEASGRAQALRAAAYAAGWQTIDLAAAAGEAQAANGIVGGLWAEFPVGAALKRVHQALADELSR